MTNDTRFDDIYTRLNDLTHDVTNLKIQAGTIGTSQVAIATTLTLATGLASDMREVKSDIRQIKSDIKNLEASIDEILRLLRGLSH
jgi:cell division protein ZapA (FtsZ GTPase activity inhibitor)